MGACDLVIEIACHHVLAPNQNLAALARRKLFLGVSSDPDLDPWNRFAGRAFKQAIGWGVDRREVGFRETVALTNGRTEAIFGAASDVF
jgi:hypothetical protein